jgi:acetolactate decarboxylase
MIKTRAIAACILAIIATGCNSSQKETEATNTYSDLEIAGAMRDVMWKGELGSKINLDTIADKKGLYGLRPESYLTGELLINDGNAYVSKVTSDSTMSVEKTFDLSAPFFVYTNVTEWNEMDLPASVKSMQDLEKYIDEQTAEYKRPFAFKVKGGVSRASIHIQNLPKGTTVSSPDEAHQGQVSYELPNEEVTVIGFFSTEHKGVFTHHDSFLHMHLINKDEDKMGHLDELEIGEMKLFLLKN